MISIKLISGTILLCINFFYKLYFKGNCFMYIELLNRFQNCKVQSYYVINIENILHNISFFEAIKECHKIINKY